MQGHQKQKSACPSFTCKLLFVQAKKGQVQNLEAQVVAFELQLNKLVGALHRLEKGHS
jgi:hypothetical protein